METNSSRNAKLSFSGSPKGFSFAIWQEVYSRIEATGKLLTSSKTAFKNTSSLLLLFNCKAHVIEQQVPFHQKYTWITSKTLSPSSPPPGFISGLFHKALQWHHRTEFESHWHSKHTDATICSLSSAPWCGRQTLPGISTRNLSFSPQGRLEPVWKSQITGMITKVNKHYSFYLWVSD